MRRAIERAAAERQAAWRSRDARDAYRLTVDLNGKVGAREASDLSATDPRGDDAYLRERDAGLFAELRRTNARDDGPAR